MPPYDYYHQSAHSPSVSLGTHLSHPHPLESRYEPPYNVSSKGSSYSSAAVNHQPIYSPHGHPGHLRTLFLDQGADSEQGALLSEVRQMLAQISALQEL